MFVRVDGEDIARKVFRRAQNGIRGEGRERKIEEVKTIRIIIYSRENFHRNIYLFFFSIPDKTLLIVCILQRRLI